MTYFVTDEQVIHSRADVGFQYRKNDLTILQIEVCSRDVLMLEAHILGSEQLS